MAELVQYTAARRALAEAVRVDEVKNIRDKAVAMQVYAQQAKDRDLIEHATEIRKRAEIRGGELLLEMGERRGQSPEKTSRGGSLPSNKEMGITDKQSHQWQAMAKKSPEEQEKEIARAKAEAAGAIDKAAKIRAREEKEEQRKADLERPVNTSLAPGLHHGDFRKLSEQIDDASAQLVFTDPPYDGDSVALYGDAARIAARILRPGGSFIAYSGQRYLPWVLAECARHLNYWWTIAGIHSGGNQILNRLGIRCGWKPLVWFVKDTRGDIQNILLDTVTGAREKDAHEWQQSEQEARYYIEKLTAPDGLVVDFFIGGGTTAVAAKALGRRCIGFEVDASAAERASKRLESA